MKKWRDLIRLSATALVVGLLAVALVGCAEQTDKTKPAPGEKPAAKPAEPAKPAAPAAPAQPAKPAEPAPAAQKKPAPPPPPAQPAKPTPPPPAQPGAQNTPKTPVQEKQVIPATKVEPAAQSNERAKEQATDLIYASIRVKMEEMIAQRAEMLKTGKPPADPEIQKLETSIMRAKKLLTEAGEIPPEIKPPIAQ